MTSQSALQSIRALLPLIPVQEKGRFVLLMMLAFVMAMIELALTGMVALLAATFGSPEAVLNNNPVLWLRTHLGLRFNDDPRLLALAVLVGILLVVVCKNILAVVQQWHMASFSDRSALAAKSHLFRFYQRAPFLWVLHTGVAELGFGLLAISNLGGILPVAVQLFTNALTLVALFAGLVCVSPVPSLLFLVILGIGGVLIMKLTRRLMDKCSYAVYIADHYSNRISHLALHGLKEMRLYGREDFLFSAYKKQLGDGVNAKIKQLTIYRFPVCGIEILGFGTLLGVMLFLVFIQDAGMARISGIMGFMAAVAWRGLPVVTRLADGMSMLRGNLPYLQKASELIMLEKKLRPELLPVTDSSDQMRFDHEITLDGISFSYPQALSPAVQDVTMNIPAGTMVGLVGLSGAGKSTLANILTGLLPPASGRILVDGVAVTKENAASWLRCIGYVAQSPYILDASLAENVALSRWGEEIDRERVLECCRMAALDFLDDLEKGIDTVLGDRGTRLSGGQAQRVAIARALYSEPALIIFDEATSALDMKNEKAIHETILSLRSRVTMVIIAHRLATVEGCDSIVWLEKGEILRIGPTESILPEYEVALGRSHGYHQ